jgi:hypothetical protein
MRHPVRLLLPFLMALLLVPLQASAADLTLGPGGPTLAEVLASAKDGDVVNVLPGEYRGQTAVITHRRLTLRGVGKRPVFVGDGSTVEGKAVWIVRGGDIRIENVEFRGARSEDGNAAALRVESGRVTVSGSVFMENQNAIVTANAEDIELSVESSEFSQVPRESGLLHHLLHAGRIGRLSIVGSRFHRGFEGHLIKSRARESLIAYNLIVDGPEGRASYEIDLPNGGKATLVGNVISQSADTQNPVVVAFGAEGRAWPESALYMSHNTLVNNRVLPAWFLRVFNDRLPEKVPVVAVNNLTVGPGVFWLGASGRFEGNWPAMPFMLVDPDTLGYELEADSWLRGRGVDPRNVGGLNLAPQAEFVFPIGTRPLPPQTSWSPGAFQR